MTKIEDIVIVVPVYKKRLDLYEKISICQLFKALSQYCIYIVTPEGFKPEYEELVNQKYEIKSFSSDFFISTEAYSKLLLSTEFYESFDNFQYMLIYQLDCFVFRDNLMEFCEMGYDYIGAPIHQKDGFWSNYHVGNGGLSLRNIRKTKEILKYINEFATNEMFTEKIRKTEDAFFSYCANEEKYDYSAAPIDVANHFSLFVDTDEKKKSICENGLPFGIHYFPKYHYDFWRSFIQIYGYKLPLIASDEKNRRYLNLMNQWLILKNERKPIDIYLKKRGINTIAIYGMGIYGRHMIRELDESNIKIEYGIDRNLTGNYKGIQIYKTTDKLEKVDTVVNTVIWDHFSITNELKKVMDCPVISLEDIIFESYFATLG